MNGLKIVFLKEVVDNIRDRRAVFGTLLTGALIGPVMFAVIINVAIHLEKERAERPLELPVIGQEYAPQLIRYLKQQGVVVEPGPDNPDVLVKDKTEDVVLRIPPEYPEQWRRGQPAVVEIIADWSRTDADRSYYRTEKLLQTYSQQTASRRLQLRGINPLITQVVVVRDVDVSTVESRGARLIGMLPFFLLMTVFTGGLYLAIDATSGEKERQSLEPLLINPVPRWHIMLGKVFAASVFSAASMVVALIAFHFAMMTLPAEELGFQINLGWWVIVQCFVIALPLTLVASCLQCIIAAFAKGFREAQAYASVLVFIPMIPSFWLMLSPVKEELWMSAVPMLSQVVLINSLIRGVGYPLSWLLLCWLSTLCLGALLCLIAAGLYNRPKMIFSA